MEHKLQQLKNYKSISLTEHERGLLRAHAVYVVATTPLAPARSWFQQGVHHGLRIALSTFMFIVFVGGTVSAVADNALPGDSLYAFKLNVNEQVKGFFLNTPEKKVANTRARIQNRVNEIQTLADSKSLTKEKQATVEKALDSHLNDLSSELDTLAPNTALSVTANLEATLKASKETLENAEVNSGTEDALQTVDGTIKKVSDQEVQIISKELDAISSGLSNTNASSSTSLNTNASSATTPASSTVTPVGP